MEVYGNTTTQWSHYTTSQSDENRSGVARDINYTQTPIEKKNTTVKLENICTKTIRTPIPSQDYFITKTHGRLIRGDITVIGEDVDYDSDNVSLKDHSYDVYKNNEIGCEHLDQFDLKLN